MYRKEVNERSPLRILEDSIHGGLGKGNLGVVMARAGVGKTGCLVQIGLDDLMRERAVLHLALEQTMDHVLSWYDALFDDLIIHEDLDDHESVRAMIARKRIIAAFSDHDLWPERLEKTVEMFKEAADFKPSAILVDGYPWEKHSLAENAAMIGALKAYAKLSDAELWMTAQTHRHSSGVHPTRVPPPCTDYIELIDVAIFLEPHGDAVTVRLLKDHDHDDVPDTHLTLHPEVLRIQPDDEKLGVPRVPSGAFTLLSGGARGSEAEFGACAEEWGLAELNFTYEGRTTERTRGVVTLNAAELGQGDVSEKYLEAHMHRRYPGSPAFKKTLQTIWHQVSTAGQVFVVGRILSDGTVKGGTGWAAELGRHWNKPVYVYDQDKSEWLTWTGDNWAEVEAPKIRARRFTGTGTRDLADNGKAAIRSLFERSFGKRPE